MGKSWQMYFLYDQFRIRVEEIITDIDFTAVAQLERHLIRQNKTKRILGKRNEDCLIYNLLG